MSNAMNEDPANEADLIRRAQGGEEAAMEALLSNHQDRVFRTALMRLGGDDDAAADVTQQVLISAFRNIRTFRGESKFSTWLHRMTVNFATNAQVSAGRRTARFVSLDAPRESESGDEVMVAPIGPGPSPREQASGGEVMALLLRRLEEVPVEFRAALKHRYLEDMSYEEISEILQLPLGTIKSRINRGRAELRRLMSDVFPEGTHDERA